MAPEGMDTSGRSARLVPMVLPLLHGATNARRRQSPDQTVERNPPSRPSASACMRARRFVVSQTAAAGAPALGLRQPKTMKRSSGFPNKHLLRLRVSLDGALTIK